MTPSLSPGASPTELQLNARRRRAADALHLGDEVLLISAGESVPIPGGADQVFPFRAHPEYFWLTGLECPGGVLTFDAKASEWVHFAPTVGELEKVWDGRRQEAGTPLAELPAWLAARRGRGIVALGVELPGLGARSDAARNAMHRERFTHARRRKDEHEMARIRHAAAATRAGFQAAAPLLRSGVSERAVQIAMEAAFFTAGADRTAYDTIVGGGPNSVIFHFTPSARPFVAGEFILIDAGAECGRYCADVTRTFTADDVWSPLHRQVHALVDAAKTKCIAMCRPGVEWRDVHRAACIVIAEGLVGLGVLKGEAPSLVDSGVMGLFFPHGVGHMVGLGVRDAGGRALGRGATAFPGGINLRVDLPLEAGFVMTVEPGLYFIPALLNDPNRRARFSTEVNWKRVGDFLTLGGVRLEDNVLITESGAENLTASIA